MFCGGDQPPCPKVRNDKPKPNTLLLESASRFQEMYAPDRRQPAHECWHAEPGFHSQCLAFKVYFADVASCPPYARRAVERGQRIIALLHIVSVMAEVEKHAGRFRAGDKFAQPVVLVSR